MPISKFFFQFFRQFQIKSHLTTLHCKETWQTIVQKTKGLTKNVCKQSFIETSSIFIFILVHIQWSLWYLVVELTKITVIYNLQI